MRSPTLRVPLRLTTRVKGGSVPGTVFMVAVNRRTPAVFPVPGGPSREKHPPTPTIRGILVSSLGLWPRIAGSVGPVL